MPDYQDIKTRVAQGFVWQTATKAVVQTFTWASTIIVAALLNPDDYGLMAIQGVYTILLVQIVEFGITNGLINAKQVSTDVFDGIFYLMITTGLIIYGLFYFITPVVSSFYDHDQLQPVMRVSGLLILIGAVKAVPKAISMRNLEYKFRSLVELASIFVSTVTVLGLAYRGYGVWSLVIATLTKESIQMLGYCWYWRHLPRPRFPWADIKAIGMVGGKILISGLAGTLYRKSDTFFLGLFAGTTATGYYNLAFTLASLPIDKIGSIFNQIAFPAFSRLREDSSGSKSLFLNLHKYLLLIGVPLLCGGVFVADDLVRLLFEEKWLPIVFPLQMIMVINILRLSEMFVAATMLGIGEINWILKYRLITALILPAGFFVGVQYGITGVLFAWLTCFPFLYAALILRLLKAMPVSVLDVGASLKPMLVSTLLMVGTLTLSLFYFDTDSANWVSLSIKIAGGATVYGLGLALLFPKDFQALWNLKNTLRKPAS
ncbi:MAG: lipopolysaccharide biosynthesis protein [Immundisolibacteraceae bacterium]|nr:lipopolysaccharide biosynthesis protein [Immundisolibacteraceae bacterium]